MIKKGDRIGFIGKTGSGKSTLLDILMALLEPTSGLIEVDGIKISLKNIRGWQTNIAHVPQSIYLADLSVLQNIAFGIENDQIDLDRVKSCAKYAQLDELIESWPNKYQTHVGERGVQLSGGQRQRIGIARALYKQANIIIFDEATSALDSETEESIINAIESLDRGLTIIMVAHRLSSLRNCCKIIELENGKIKSIINNQ
jgi:ATP-binding cassette subfamily B protein